MFSSNSSQVSSAANYIEDVFSTYLYTGNGSTQTITNGIDLSTKGGMVWIKSRSIAASNSVMDTLRGPTQVIVPNQSGGQGTYADELTSFNSNGFSLGPDTNTAGQFNGSGNTYVSWSFRKQPKYFDVVTYTGNGSNRTIAHSLGATPGCIMVKRTDDAGDWQVYHNGLTSAAYTIRLDLTAAQISSPTVWNSTAPTSTVFSVGTNADVNASGGTYVAYLFAHDAGGFGLTGTDNVISCGSFANGSSSVTLGWEPQWILAKPTGGADGVGWSIVDSMRGLNYSNDPYLMAQSSSAEMTNGGAFMQPTATGFNVSGLSGTGPFIYIAIRRGPMKVPTDATKVFTQALKPTNPLTVGFPMDFEFWKWNDGTQGWYVYDRLRGNTPALNFNTTNAENTSLGSQGGFDSPTNTNNSSTFVGPTYYMGWYMRRAPGFFDEVCYTGTGTSYRSINHNLGVTPELIIVKNRSSSAAWKVSIDPAGLILSLNTTAASGQYTGGFPYTNSATLFDVFDNSGVECVNTSGATYVAYLFATCPGVSKVGSYTGTGATQTISCGFTGGARFVLVKRTDTTGDWYVWDTARGMVSGTDPSLLLNSTAAEVNANSIYTATGGFQIVSTAAGINASGGTYIYLAIA